MTLFFGKTRKTGGFSLFEVMLVIVILVAAFLPLIQIVSKSLIISGEAKGTNMALKLAQSKLEQFKNTAYSSISNEAKTAVTGSPGYSRQVVVTTPSTGLRNVSVIVYWYTTDGSQISLEVSSFITGF